MGFSNPLHILILLLVVLLVFGAKRLPEIGRSLGEGMRGFKDTIQADSHETRAVDRVVGGPAPLGAQHTPAPVAASATQPPVADLAPHSAGAPR